MSSPTPSTPVTLDNVVELPGHKDYVFNIMEMPEGRRVATACGDKVVRVFDTQTGNLLHALNGHTSDVCGLAPLGQDLLASGEWSDAGTLCVWDTSTGACLSKRPMGGKVRAIAKLGEGEVVMSAGADLVFVSHTDGRALVESRRVSSAHEKFIGDLAAGGGRVVTVAEDGSVRVWDACSGASVAELVAHVSGVTRVSVKDKFAACGSTDGSVCVYRLDTLELVRSLKGVHDGKVVGGVELVGTDGGYVVSAGWDKMVRVSEVATGREVVRAELGLDPYRLRLLRDGRVAAGGIAPNTAKIFELPRVHDLLRAAAYAPNPIEAAFRSAIAAVETGDDTLSIDLLSTVLVRENIDSVSALFWAHNLVLLAIRCEILTPDAVNSFGGKPFYLMEQVYFPVSKLNLSDEEKLVAMNVLAHAESVGVITNGFDTVAAWDLREAVGRDMRTVSQALAEMAQRISSVETRLDKVEDENKSTKEWSDAATAKINELVGHSEKQRNEVLQLSRSFNELHSRLREKESKMRVMSVTRAALSVIPVVGSAVGNASYAAAEMLLGLTTEKLVEVGVGAAKGGVSLLGGVDVSNFTAARRLLSEKGLDKLGPAAKEVVSAAAKGSAFESFTNLEQELREASRNFGPESGHVVGLLDLGDKSWVEARRFKTKSGACSSKVDRERELADRLSVRFRFLCREEGRKDILLDDACDEIQPLLSWAGYQGTFDKNVLYDALEKACGSRSRGRVNENAFEEAFQSLMEEFGLINVREDSDPSFFERFAETAGKRKRISVRNARFPLMELFTDRTEGISGDDSDSVLDFTCVTSTLSLEEAGNVLSACCESADVDMVGVDEFEMACRKVFYGE